MGGLIRNVKSPRNAHALVEQRVNDRDLLARRLVVVAADARQMQSHGQKQLLEIVVKDPGQPLPFAMFRVA